jgi:hypothetical protein
MAAHSSEGGLAATAFPHCYWNQAKMTNFHDLSFRAQRQLVEFEGPE